MDHLSVCLSHAAFLHYCTKLDVLGNGRGCPRVVYYWRDLQSMPGFYCYDNITYSYVQYNYRLTSELVLALTLFSQPPVKFTKT